MKNITRPPIRALGIILMFLWSLQLKAQTANTAVLTWDQQVGCITYDDDPKDMPSGEQHPPYTGINLTENILDGTCIRFCEDTLVTFSLNTNDEVEYVEWAVSGGILEDNSNSHATVVWEGRGSGSITLTIFYGDGTVSTRTFCVEKIARPMAFYQMKGPNPNQTNFIVNTNVSFKNLSTANGGTSLVSYVWDFGDGQVSTAIEPVHQYTAPGNYQVKLTVANSCNCTTVYYKTLSIDIPIPGCPYPILSCISMTCEGNVEHYTVNEPAGGTWTVDGGTILGSNTGQSIDVRWDKIDPNSGMGSITYQSKCYPYPISEVVPVIVRRANIIGPKDFCEGDQQLYTLPRWPTTEFEWALNGMSADNPNNHFLTHTANRNEILVGSLPAGTYHLTARYRNTLLLADNCRGEAEFTFTVNEKPVIQTNGPLVFCVAEKIDFTSASGNPVNWEIYLGSNLVHKDHAASTAYDFDKVGTYVVTAESNGCIGDPVLVEALPVPEITGNITGPQTVCLNVPYTYTINENDPSAFYSWSVSGGNIIGSNGGTQVDVFFTAANATVTVEKKYVNKGVTCTSQSISYPVSELVLSPAIVNNNGTTQFCPSTTYTFTADLNGIVADHIEWELTPPKFGNIIAGVNDNTVTLTLNEVSNNNTIGVLKLTATKCGVEEVRTININLNPKVELTIDDIEPICPSYDIVFDLTMNTTVPNNPGTYWAFEYNGVQGATEPYVSSATNNYTFTIPQLFPAGTNAVAGVLGVKLVNPYGCTMEVAAYKNVTILPKTTVELYNVAGGNRLCNPIDAITLQATVSTGVTEDFTYKWFYDNGTTTVLLSPIQYSGSTVTLSTANSNNRGNYYVQVTDVNDCIITSNSINIFGCSGGGDDDDNDDDGSHCNLGFSTTPTLTYNWISCDKVEVTASYDPSANIDHVNWSQSQPGITLETSPVPTDFKATYKITRAGIHNVTVTAYYAGCDYGFTRSVKITKNYEPILRYTVTCGANGNYTIALKNNTKLFDRTINDNDIEYFDISGSIPVSVGTGQVVTLNKTAGTYTYRMVLSGTTPTNIPVCQPEVTIVIANPPSTNVVTPAQNSTYCAEEPILVSIPGGYNSNYRYEWHFNGTQYVATSANSYINITDPGTHTITLKIINDHGCEFVSAPINVTIIKAAFDGAIDPADPDYCETDALPLEYKLSNPVSPLNPAPTTITWMLDDQPVHTGTTYQPTQSGSYWAVLTDASGCKDYSLVKTPVLYKLRKPPFASVKGNTSVCYGESTTLVGIYTDPTVEHRWTLNGVQIPGSLGNWISGANNLDITHTGSTPGTYTYAFETRRTSGDTDCIGKFEAVVVVHPPVDPLFIDISFACYYDQQQKFHRYITLTALGGDPNGTYSWSNGANTESIKLFDGGVFTLTYTAPNGCTATSTVNIPKYPDDVLWVVPKGCYQICGSSNAYLLGPLGNYDWYYWYINNGIYLQGSNLIPPLYVNQPGTNIYNLNISQNGCLFSSPRPEITVLACRPGTGSKGTAAETTPAIVVNTITATFVVAPNPAVDVATVLYDTGTQNATAVTVYNLKGAQLLQQQVSGTKGEVQLNVSHLAAGTYMVNLHAGNTVIAQQKLIKR